MADRSSQTEKPTQRRLEKARKEGQFASAREFVGALQFLLFVALLGMGPRSFLAGFRQTTRDLFLRAFAGDLGVQELTHLAWTICWKHFLPLVLAGAALALFTLAVRLVTTRFGFSLKKLAPDWKRLNPV